ncbi:hypothetical protein OY671_011335, partial [Metschnikowia pulcherrima]
YSQASVIFPYISVAPAYFANKMQLGGMMQTASAFGSVQGALSFFISTYRSLAEWQAVVARLNGFEAGIDAAKALAVSPDSIQPVAAQGADIIALDDSLLTSPNGKPSVQASGFKSKSGERTSVTGPSGSGKSTSFRAIAGIWPFGKGAISIPKGASLMMSPQR